MPQRLITFLFCLILASTAMAQSLGQPYIQHFSRNVDYLDGSDQNWAVTQHPNGMIYVANSQGVLEYDGNTWRLIPVGGSPRALAVNQEGRIYVGGQGVIGFLALDSAQSLQYVSIKHLTPAFQNISNIHAVEDGVFFQSERLIYHFDGQTIKIVYQPADREAEGINHSLYENGSIYFIERGKGLIELKTKSSGTAKQWQYLPNTQLISRLDLLAVLPISNNHLFLVTSKGLYIYQNNRLTLIESDITKILERQLVTKGIRYDNQTLILPSILGGVYFLNKNGQITYQLNEDNGLATDNIKSIYKDNLGFLWLATEIGVTYVEYPSSISNIDDRNGLRGIVESIGSYNGRMFIGTGEGIFQELNPLASNPFKKRFRPLEGLPFQAFDIKTINNRLYAATSGGVFEIAPNIRLVTLNPSAYLHQVSFDGRYILVGQKTGLSLLRQEGNFLRFNKSIAPSQISEEIRHISESADGSFWLGTRQNGLIRIKFPNNNPLLNPDIDYFNEQHQLTSGPVRSVTIDGTLYAATNEGLFTWDAEKQNFNHSNPFDSTLSDGSRWVTKVEDDGFGRIWFFAGYDNNNQTEVFMILPGDTSYIINRNPFKRFKNKNIFAFYSPTQNVTWMGGSTDGVVIYNHQSMGAEEKPVTAIIRRFTTNINTTYFAGTRSSVSIEPEFNLGYDENAFRFTFSSSFLLSPQNNEFQSYLFPFEQGWSNWSTENTKDYTNISPGDYTFYVRTKNIYGKISEPVAMSFNIRSPWFWSWYTQIIYLLILGYIVFYIFQWRTKYLTERNLELEKTIEEKTTQLLRAEKLASIGQLSSGLAHEINNPLTFISANIELLNMRLRKLTTTYENLVNDKDNALTATETVKADIDKAIQATMDGTNRIKNIVQSMMAFSGSEQQTDVTANLNDQIEKITEVYFSQTDQIKVDLQLNPIPEFRGNVNELNLTLINIMLNGIQAIQENIKKGVVDSENGLLIVSTRKMQVDRSTYIQISIKDNGNGIPAENLKKIFDPFFTTKSIGAGRGLGLSEAYAFIKKIDGDIKVESEVGVGTTITISVPGLEI